MIDWINLKVVVGTDYRSMISSEFMMDFVVVID